MTGEKCRKLRAELREIVEKERELVLENEDPELYLYSDKNLAEELYERGYQIKTLAIYYHRKLLNIPRMGKRWKKYQQERNKKNGKKKVCSSKGRGENQTRKR